jgi:hypothetical protein
MRMLRSPGTGSTGDAGGAVGDVGLLAGRREAGVDDGGVGGRGGEEVAAAEEGCCAWPASGVGPATCCVSRPHV